MTSNPAPIWKWLNRRSCWSCSALQTHSNKVSQVFPMQKNKQKTPLSVRFSRVVTAGLISLIVGSFFGIINEIYPTKKEEKVIGYHLPRRYISEIDFFDKKKVDDFLASEQTELNLWGQHRIPRAYAKHISENYFVTGNRMSQLGINLKKTDTAPQQYAVVLTPFSVGGIIVYLIMLISSLVLLAVWQSWRIHALKKRIDFLYSKL